MSLQRYAEVRFLGVNELYLRIEFEHKDVLKVSTRSAIVCLYRDVGVKELALTNILATWGIWCENSGLVK